MKDTFLRIPSPLQRQILLRCIGGILGLIMTLLLLIYDRDWRLLLPCILLTLFCLGSAASLYDLCAQQKYIEITGCCTDIEKAGLRRWIKAIYIRHQEHSIKIMCAHKVKDITVGDEITVYLTDRTAIYEVNEWIILCNYLALTKKNAANRPAK